jgi:very-short-patch-repair endonuclease
MAFDIAARRPLEDAVADLDVVLSARTVDRASLCTWLEDRHEDDVVAVREAAALSDGRAASPPESRLRVRLSRSDLGVVVEPQHVVQHRGAFVARVDLAVVALKIAIEYEGAWHGLIADQLARDRQRLDRLREAGWIVVHVTADMMRTPGMAVDAVRRAIAQRRA